MTFDIGLHEVCVRVGVRYVITKFSLMGSLPNFLTHGAPLRARFARARAPLWRWWYTTSIYRIKKHGTGKMSSLKQQISLIHTKNLGDIKGTQPAMGPCWPGHYLLSVEKRLLQPKLIKYTLRIHSRDTFRNLLQSCLVFNSIRDLWMIPSFRANFYPSCNIILPASKGTWKE